LPITRGKYPAMVFVAFGGACRNVVHLELNTWVGAAVILFDGWLEIFGVSDRPEML
jgi:hypothetical protein